MNKVLASLAIILLSINLSGQNTDKVYLKSKRVVEGKVIQVTANSLEIDPIGEKPFLIIPRDSIEVLIYSDNTVVNFQSMAAPDEFASSPMKEFTIGDKYVFPPTKPWMKWEKHHIFFKEQLPFKDSINNIDLKLNCKGYYHVKKTSSKTFAMGFIKLEIDLLYNGEVYSEEILVDEKAEYKFNSEELEFPGTHILNMGLYNVVIKFTSSGSGYNFIMYASISSNT